jgi:predicted nucleotidyltransferase
MNVEESIKQNLKEIEQQKNVKILFASESGSRAWGFPSQDSDYDVRFIYAHEPDWYLSVVPRKDVIEIPIESEMDMGGWDIRKSFALLRKCNCALIEWLSSPIVYTVNEEAIAPLKNMISKAFLPRTACHHYLSLSSRKTDEIMQSDRTKLKAYFYALRASLCAKHIVDEGTAPPMSIDLLLAKYFADTATRNKIKELRKQKLQSTEKDLVGRIDWLDQFLTDTIKDVENRLPENGKKAPLEEYDEAFRKTLKLIR